MFLKILLSHHVKNQGETSLLFHRIVVITNPYSMKVLHSQLGIAWKENRKKKSIHFIWETDDQTESDLVSHFYDHARVYVSIKYFMLRSSENFLPFYCDRTITMMMWWGRRRNGQVTAHLRHIISFKRYWIYIALKERRQGNGIWYAEPLDNDLPWLKCLDLGRLMFIFRTRQLTFVVKVSSFILKWACISHILRWRNVEMTHSSALELRRMDNVAWKIPKQKTEMFTNLI